MSWKEKLKKYYIDLVSGKRHRALDALFCFFLTPSSLIYELLVRLALDCYQSGLCRSHKPDCKVISVGNITWGGTGKTSLVQVLVKLYKQQGKNPVVLMRGYGQDEPELLRNKFIDLPVLAGKNRIKTARIAVGRYAANPIILDDGFQHWRLRRDLDIVLIDAARAFGNGMLIPRGILREPLSSLQRADVFLLTNLDSGAARIEEIKGQLHRYNPQAPIYTANYLPQKLYNLISGEELTPQAIKDIRVAVLCAIGNPESFARTVSSLGAEICLKLFLSDHYQYVVQDLEMIQKQCLDSKIETIVTTEKDTVKLKPILQSISSKLKILALSVELKIAEDEQNFFNFLLNDKRSAGPYSILVLSDGKAGHLNQSKTIARIVQQIKTEQAADSQIETRIIEVKFKNALLKALLSFCALFSGGYCRRCLSCLRFCLRKVSFQELMQLRADLIISCGSSQAAVNIFLGLKDKARKIILMKPPLLTANRFDLVIAPEHDRVKPKDNIFLTRIAPNLIDQEYLAEQARILKTKYEIRPPAQENTGRAGKTKYEDQGPTIGVLIGGDAANYRLGVELAAEMITQLKRSAEDLNGRLLITTSRRTPAAVERLFKAELGEFSRCSLLIIANEKNIPEAVGGILGLSDIVVVSGESISMVSEAASSEKYVLVLPAQKTQSSVTKQEKFLKRLEQTEAIKVIRTQLLVSAIKDIWQRRPSRKRIQHRQQLTQAISRVL